MKNVMLLMAAAILMSACKDDNSWEPEPPIPPVPELEMVNIAFGARIAPSAEKSSLVQFVSKWNEGHRLWAYSEKSKEALGNLPKQRVAETRNSPVDPVSGFGFVEGIGTDSASIKGRIYKDHDSLVVFRISKVLSELNYVKREYETDSLPDVFRYDDLLMGTARIDTVNGTSVTMKHITSILDVKLINKTGLDLKVLKVVIHPEAGYYPFYSSARECLYSYGKMESTRNGALYAEYSKGYVKKDDVFTVRHILLMINDSALEGKRLTYSVLTDHGIYSYTKTGKKYEGGLHHVEEIVMEAQ